MKRQVISNFNFYGTTIHIVSLYLWALQALNKRFLLKVVISYAEVRWLENVDYILFLQQNTFSQASMQIFMLFSYVSPMMCSLMRLKYYFRNRIQFHQWKNLQNTLLTNGLRIAILVRKQKKMYFFEIISFFRSTIYRYEGAAFAKPLTNNECKSINAIIKQKYTLRNKLHLSAFLLKIQHMPKDCDLE